MEAHEAVRGEERAGTVHREVSRRGVQGYVRAGKVLEDVARRDPALWRGDHRDDGARPSGHDRGAHLALFRAIGPELLHVGCAEGVVFGGRHRWRRGSVKEMAGDFA